MKKTTLFIAIVFLITFVIAEQSSLGVFKQYECISLIQICANCSYINITSVNYPNSSMAISNKAMTKSGTEFTYPFCNTSLLGQYIVNGVGDIDGLGTIFAYDFEITVNGKTATTGRALIDGALILVLVVFLICSLWIFLTTDNLLGKVGMVGFGYLLLIAISFISWNMASDFLLSAPFLASFFKILFIVLMVGLLPLIIGGFVWYFFMVFKVKEIERLMTRGFSVEEAKRRTK